MQHRRTQRIKDTTCQRHFQSWPQKYKAISNRISSYFQNDNIEIVFVLFSAEEGLREGCSECIFEDNSQKTLYSKHWYTNNTTGLKYV